MSGLVSYELFNSRVPGGLNGFTTDGGIYETFTNRTGTSVKGTIVVAASSTYDSVSVAPANSTMPIGVIYEADIADGSPVKVVVYGKAHVLLENGQSATRGYWCGVSGTEGRMYQASAPPANDHYREIGHSLQTITNGTNVLSLVQLHFN